MNNRPKPKREIFECPHCGADVAIGARACRECGSDAGTGWQDSESIDYTSVDLPDGYRDEARSDFVPAPRRRLAMQIIALVLVAALVWLAVQRYR